MQPNDLQLARIRERICAAKSRASSFYASKFKDIDASAITSPEAFEALPFTEKSELRSAYPLGIQAVPDEEIVRIHSSSGTTGKPIIIPYTQQDVDDWALMFERCYSMAGLTRMDRVQITPGYGLWTAGIGFQLGCERLGAMAIPMGPGNTDKQIQMMMDLGATVLCATSSYALLLAEEIEHRKLGGGIRLKKAIIGSERWGDKMRERISRELGVELYDIYGLTEIYGPGIGISCSAESAIHYFDDFIYLEIIDPKTGRTLPDGETGEIVITTLRKEGAPLIRYRTHDLSRIIPERCSCGSTFPRIDRIAGRSDDMFKVKGVNMFPSQIEDLLRDIPGVSSEYQIRIEHRNDREEMTLSFEIQPGCDPAKLEAAVRRSFKARVGLTIRPQAMSIGELPRSEKKTARVVDLRD
ncbi:MAG: phenylacetate--CoA ligase [Clostridia bacterium]|nr:phenylacetate--CoA ligase [Clostridia bacterium]